MARKNKERERERQRVVTIELMVFKYKHLFPWHLNVIEICAKERENKIKNLRFKWFLIAGYTNLFGMEYCYNNNCNEYDDQSNDEEWF